MKKIFRFIIVATLTCYYGLTAVPASAETVPYICDYCVNKCQDLHGKQLIDCFNRCEPDCSSGQSLMGGGVLRASRPFALKCEICKKNCGGKTDSFNCCSECELICGNMTNCPPK